MPPMSASVYANRNFMLIWLGQGVSVIGDRVHGLVVAWWVLDRTGDPAMVGRVLLAATLPLVLLAPLGGALADRWDRRSLLCVSDLLRGLLVLSLAGLELSGGLNLTALIAVTVGVNCLSAVFLPTLLAVTPTLVDEEQVLQASSLQDAVAGGAGIVGPAIGGVLVAAVGPGLAFAINGTSYLVAAASTLAARIPSPPATPGPSVGAQILDGFAYLRQERLILGMIAVFGALNFFASPIQMYLPGYAKLVYQRGPQALGAMEAALSAGMVLAGVLLAQSAGRRRKAMPIFGSILATGALFLAFGAPPPYHAALAVLVAMGFAIGVANVFILVLFQERVPADRLGRVMGLVTTVTTAAQPAAYAVAGLAGAVWPVPTLALASGAGVILGALFLLTLRGFRDI
jgi:DHA3 family macrolide efflux protein-like MFS transporter